MARRLEVVVDSSVAVKWFSEEEATPHALELRDSHLTLPQLKFVGFSGHSRRLHGKAEYL